MVASVHLCGRWQEATQTKEEDGRSPLQLKVQCCNQGSTTHSKQSLSQNKKMVRSQAKGSWFIHPEAGGCTGVGSFTPVQCKSLQLWSKARAESVVSMEKE